MHRSFLLPMLAALASPVAAAERQFTVTSFDRVVVEGPFEVTVTTGRGASARARGDMRAIDGIALQSTGRTLTLRASRSGWGGWPGEAAGRVLIELSTPALSSARLGGSGRLKVDRLSGGTTDVLVSGDGALDIAKVESDRMTVALIGAGSVKLAGRSSQATMVLQGAGRIDGAALAADDVTVTSSGTGTASLSARRSARVTASGAGSVDIAGGAACLTKISGSAAVRC